MAAMVLRVLILLQEKEVWLAVVLAQVVVLVALETVVLAPMM
jgi:hypothetical protein